MAAASLTRRVAFAAAHRYHRPDWSEERNHEVFGACSWPNYHGHSYTCDVTVSGPISDETGFVVDLGELDRILDREVHSRFDHRNLNLDIPEFAAGRMVPSGENLARFIYQRVLPALPPGVHLDSVTVAEDATLSVTYRG